MRFCVFFFNDTATTEIYTLSLHDALPICLDHRDAGRLLSDQVQREQRVAQVVEHAEEQHDVERLLVEPREVVRSEEHTSELQSRQYLVCRLLLEKKNKIALKSTSINSMTD